MNTQYFKYAVEIERTRSITQAAENLYMGQPNLSRAVKELEETLGFAIFERTTKGVVPTEKGTEFLTYAKNVLVQLDNMERLAGMATGELQTLSVAVPRASYISKALAEFVSEMDFERPIDINIKETNAMQSITDVTEQRHDFAIIRYRMQNESYFNDYLNEKKLKYEVLWEFERIILTSEKNMYIKSDMIKREDLSKCIELMHGDTLVPYHRQNKKTSSSDKAKNIRLYERANQFELLSRIPEAYIWTSPVPKSHLERYGLVMVHSDRPGRTYRDVIIYPSGYTFSDIDKRFINKVYAAKNELAL